MATDDHETFRRLIDDFDTGMLVTLSADGLHARPMAIAAKEPNCDLWFLTGSDSGKVREVEAESHATVVFQSPGRFISIAGVTEVVHDRTRIAELWKEPFKVWFPEGKDDPAIALLHFRATEGEVWDNSGFKKVKYVIEAARAYLGGRRPEELEDLHRKAPL
jgi:general stress protein 26